MITGVEELKKIVSPATTPILKLGIPTGFQLDALFQIPLVPTYLFFTPAKAITLVIKKAKHIRSFFMEI